MLLILTDPYTSQFIFLPLTLIPIAHTRGTEHAGRTVPQRQRSATRSKCNGCARYDPYSWTETRPHADRISYTSLSLLSPAILQYFRDRKMVPIAFNDAV